MRKKQYKIYCATNTENGKQYVGQTPGSICRSLVNRHLAASTYFGDAIRTLGPDIFEWSVLDYAETREELNQKEILWIKKLDTIIPNGYNVHSGGGQTEGWQSSEVSIQARVLAQTGMKKTPCSEQTKKKISETKRNNNLYRISPETNLLDFKGREYVILSTIRNNEPIDIERIVLLVKGVISSDSDYTLRRNVTYHVNRLEKQGVCYSNLSA